MIEGFSRLSAEEKRKRILEEMGETTGPTGLQFIHQDEPVQQLLETFSENVMASYPFPYSVAPNFLINNCAYLIPMVTEESSVVAAASQSAKFWNTRGGFRAEVTETIKEGHVHFLWHAGQQLLERLFAEVLPELLKLLAPLDEKMQQRGGGVRLLQIENQSEKLAGYYRICLLFDTCDAMGANYMNSCLETVAKGFVEYVSDHGHANDLEVIMSILSNYSPQNTAKVWVECPIEMLADKKNPDPAHFAKRFKVAVDIAKVDVYRAVTHNKGMYNGIDAVALATGNDWRAIEANGHAYAATSGNYRSLSQVEITDGIFRLQAEIPMQVGTVGGITRLHPGAKLSMQLLGNPSAKELMMVMASAGLASNFAAVKALVTSGIQQGHMKMHLGNILAGLGATPSEKEQISAKFQGQTVTHAAVERYLHQIRNA